MVVIDAEDSDEPDEDMSADLSGSECSGTVRQATPYPKSKPMSTSSSFKGTPHPMKQSKPSSVRSVRSVASKKARKSVRSQAKE